MKKNFGIKSNIRIAALTSLCIGGLSITQIANAQTIAGDFYNDTAPGQAPSGTASVGPAPTTGYNEINIDTNSSSAIPLLDNSGATSTAGLSFLQGGNALNGNGVKGPTYSNQGSTDLALSDDQQLYNGSAQAVNSLSQELSFTNIPYVSFSLYLFVSAPQQASNTPSVTGSLQIFNGGTAAGAGTTYFFMNTDQTGSPIPSAGFSYVQAQGTTSDTATAGANYVLFTGLTNANETVDLSYVQNLVNGSYQNNINISGFEIVDNAVPEPSTWTLLGGGAFALLAISRLRRTDHI